jgi:CheY-like chemotaxis protein
MDRRAYRFPWNTYTNTRLEPASSGCHGGVCDQGALQLKAVTSGEDDPLTKHILIVDDSDFVRTAVRHFLGGQPGFGVCGEAFDGPDALEKTRFLTPDLIILDLTRPRMNGFQTARELRAMKSSAPIFLVTVSAELVRPEQALAAGVTAVVAKEDLCRLQLHPDTLLTA